MALISNYHLVAQMIANVARSGGASGAVPSPPALPGDSTASIFLPPPAEFPLRTLADVIRRRRSGPIVKGAIGAEQLAALLSAWHTELPSSLLPDPSLRTLAFPVVLAVQDLPRAAYRYDASTRRLLTIGPVTRAAIREDILLQWEHGNAAVLIFLVVPLSRWLHGYGDRGYRSLAIQTGWITDRVYLIAETLGLSYSASGGYAPTRADRLLCLDGYHYTAFFSFIVGGTKTHR